uniref:Uncharacterized protein n=1 Tax=Dendroctonus ponderosae TaxID=77166 RepID=J3JVR5_DENPD|nr:unknown [Dendroctonus ponderosae]
MSVLSSHDKAVLACVFNPNLPIEDAEIDVELQDQEEETANTISSKKMEIQAVTMVEKGNFTEGLNMLNRAVETAPNRPSLYNNRAYVYQYLRRFEDAFNDLTIAIELCTNQHQKTLCQAYCQRGILHKRAGRKELAKADFDKASALGSKFAKSQLVELNPYAALCNQMLRHVIDKLKENRS